MPDAPLTRETLAELRRLLEAATPRPWHVPDGDCDIYGPRSPSDLIVECWFHREQENAALIAAAINALPALLAAAERGLGAGDGR